MAQNATILRTKAPIFFLLALLARCL